MLSVDQIALLLLAFIAAVFSVYVWWQYRKDKVGILRSRRQVNKGLADMSTLAEQMVVALQRSDPAVVNRALDEIAKFGAIAEEMPDKVFKKVRATYAASMKKEYRDQQAVMDIIDGGYDEQMAATLESSDANPFAKAVIKAAMAHPELAPFAQQYAESRQKNPAPAEEYVQPEPLLISHPLG